MKIILPEIWILLINNKNNSLNLRPFYKRENLISISLFVICKAFLTETETAGW